MKLTKKLLVLMLSIVVVVAALAVTAIYAAGGESNVSLSVEKTEVKVGETFTVVLTNEDMCVKTFTAGVQFDTEYLECVSIVGGNSKKPTTPYLKDEDGWVKANAMSTVAQATENSKVGFGLASTDDWDYVSCTLFTVTFKAKKAGTTNIISYENTDGTDAFVSDSIETKTVTIAAAHTCGTNMTPVDGVPATCPEAGYKPYFQCDCGIYYEDATATAKIGDDTALAAWKAEGGNGYLAATGMHDYNNAEHKCVCGDIEKFELLVEEYDHVEGCYDNVTIEVPFGASVLDVLNNAMTAGTLTKEGTKLRVNSDDRNGEEIFGSFYYLNEEDEEQIPVSAELKMPATSDESPFYIYRYIDFIGWYYTDFTEDGSIDFSEYYGTEYGYYSGWSYIEEDYDNIPGGAWYYFTETIIDGITWYNPATGVSRVPYPTVAINGVTYEADAETIAYCETKGTTFIDEESALFVFGKDGKFQGTNTGLITYKDATRYVVNGMLTWHPGFVTVDDTLYYFIGDLVNGGNVPANGETYITKVNGVEGYKAGDIVTFVNGQIKTDLDGIVNGCYYENGKLAYGKGLVALDVNGETKYIFVRSNGQLAFGEYWISADKLNGLPVKAKMYDFGRDGYLQNPVDPSLNGVVDGYFYENGSVAYGAGLVEWNGGVYYVRSNGQVATGTYYVTNLGSYEGDDIKVGDKLNFADDGKLLESKNGVIDGYYYEKNVIVYGAGLIEWNGDVYYVRSNGQVATGTYYVTNVANYKGDDIKSGDKLVFAEDGKLIK